jgi:hypothetical protein
MFDRGFFNHSKETGLEMYSFRGPVVHGRGDWPPLIISVKRYYYVTIEVVSYSNNVNSTIKYLKIVKVVTFEDKTQYTNRFHSCKQLLKPIENCRGSACVTIYKT